MIYILYLIDFLDKISLLCCVGLLLSLTLTIISFVQMLSVDEDSLYKLIKKKWLVPLLLMIILTLIPSKTTMYLMVSTKVMESIVSNEKTMNIGDKTLKILEKKLDELLKDGKS